MSVGPSLLDVKGFEGSIKTSILMSRYGNTSNALFFFRMLLYAAFNNVQVISRRFLGTLQVRGLDVKRL